MLSVVYRCVIDSLHRRRASLGILGTNGYTIIDPDCEPPLRPSSDHTNLFTYADEQQCLPDSFFRPFDLEHEESPPSVNLTDYTLGDGLIHHGTVKLITLATHIIRMESSIPINSTQKGLTFR